MDGAVRERAVEMIRTEKRGGEISPKLKIAGYTAIMEILDDQAPHSLSELASQANIPVRKVTAFVDFMAKYALVIYDARKQIVVISPDFVLL